MKQIMNEQSYTSIELKAIIKEFKALAKYEDKLNYWYKHQLGWICKRTDGVYVNKIEHLDYPQQLIDIWTSVAQYSLEITFDLDSSETISVIPYKDNEEKVFAKLIIMIIENDLQRFSEETFLNRKNSFDLLFKQIANCSVSDQITAINQEINIINGFIAKHSYTGYKVFDGFIEYNILESVIANIFFQYGLGIDKLLDLSLLYDARRFLNYLNTLSERISPKIVPNNLSEIIIPDNLQALWSIWNNPDKKTLIDIYSRTKNIVTDKEILRNFCFILYQKKWINLPYGKGNINLAKIFCDLYNFKLSISNEGSRFNVGVPRKFSPEKYKPLKIEENPDCIS